MTNEEAIKILRYNMELARFNPNTGETIPMNKDCEELADACPLRVEPPEDFMNKPEEEEPIPMFVDYSKAKECRNTKAWYTCYKCGKCGRRFENGLMVDSGGTHPDEEDE